MVLLVVVSLYRLAVPKPPREAAEPEREALETHDQTWSSPRWHGLSQFPLSISSTSKKLPSSCSGGFRRNGLGALFRPLFEARWAQVYPTLTKLFDKSTDGSM
eukprot:6679793-Prymnesium_polylepis.1